MGNISRCLTHTSILRAVALLSFSVIFLLLMAMLWLPPYLAEERHSTDIYNLNGEVGTLRSKIASAKLLQRNRHELTGVVERLSQRISQSILIEELNKIVSITGVVLVDQAFRETAMVDNVKQFKQTLAISGKYKQIRHLLAQLSSSMPGLNVVSQISINKDKGDLVSAQIELNTYSNNTNTE